MVTDADKVLPSALTRTTNIAESLNGALNSYLPKRSVPLGNGIEALHQFKRARLEAFINFKNGKFTRSRRETIVRAVLRHRAMLTLNQMDFSSRGEIEKRNMGNNVGIDNEKVYLEYSLRHH